MSSGDGRARVSARVRALTRREKNRGATTSHLRRVGACGVAVLDDGHELSFALDRAHWDDAGAASSSHASIFHDIGAPALEDAWRGVNVGVCVVGSPGAGRADALLGTAPAPGARQTRSADDDSATRALVSRFGDALFEKIERDTTEGAHVTVEAFAIHRERVFDRLTTTTTTTTTTTRPTTAPATADDDANGSASSGFRLEVDAHGHPRARGVTTRHVANATELDRAVAEAAKMRAGDPNANAAHFVIRVCVRRYKPSHARSDRDRPKSRSNAAAYDARTDAARTDAKPSNTVSVVTFAELAGFERVLPERSDERWKRKRDRRGDDDGSLRRSQRQLEIALLKLAAGSGSGSGSGTGGSQDGGGAREPEGSGTSRGSKRTARGAALTTLLRSELGGGGKLYALAVVSPTAEDRSETVATLRIARAFRNARTGPVVINVDPDAAAPAALKSAARELNDDARRLQRDLAMARVKRGSHGGSHGNHATSQDNDGTRSSPVSGKAQLALRKEIRDVRERVDAMEKQRAAAESDWLAKVRCVLYTGPHTTAFAR